MCAKSRRRHQNGFSLPETLIAAAIAAGVVAAAAQSISASVRLLRAVEREQRALSEAETISARLLSGMSDEDALEGFAAWTIARETVPPLHEYEPAVFDRVTLTSDLDPDHPIDLWAPSASRDTSR